MGLPPAVDLPASVGPESVDPNQERYFAQAALELFDLTLD
jgi:hypothetical protein